MATCGSSLLEDIDEQFCQCSICLQQYREPKQLPCLHRYCSDCLKQLIERNQGVGVVSCPECRSEFTIPTKGVSELKTDFYMKNIVEYIKLQKSLEDPQSQECFDCSKTVKVVSYCFKCTGFLCHECHKNHMTKNPWKDHKKHALSVEDLKQVYLTFEILSGLKEAPKCYSHPKHLFLLCCRTCENLPICLTCTYGSHKSHVINDVGTFAKQERKAIKNELKKLSQNKEQMMKVPAKVDRLKAEIITYVENRKEKLALGFEREIQTMKRKINRSEDDFKLSQTEIENKQRTELLESKKQMDEEMKQVQMKYANIFDEIKTKYRVEIENLKQKQEKGLRKSREVQSICERNFQISIQTEEERQNEGLLKLKEISKQNKVLNKRCDNLMATGYSVLDTGSNWATVQCIPVLCKAIEPLRQDMKRELSDLDSLISRIRANPGITEDEGSPVSIEEIANNDWRITGSTNGGDGSIVIAGCTSVDCQSHITVIIMKGKVLRKRKLKGRYQSPDRHCAYLSKLIIATVCHRNEIGICNLSDYSYIAKNISDVISSWPVQRSVSCVAIDPVRNLILVGGANSRDVYVFDYRLNYEHILTLPAIIKYPYHMTVNAGKLLICDHTGKRAYVVAIEGLEGKLIHECTKPNFDLNDWVPISVCTDRNGFIYILWMVENLPRRTSVVAQYTPDGGQLLTVKQIDASDARCITTVKTDKTEKLLVATLHSGKLHIYSLS